MGRRLAAVIVLLAVGVLAWWIVAGGPGGDEGRAQDLPPVETGGDAEAGDGDIGPAELGDPDLTRTDTESGGPADGSGGEVEDARLRLPSFTGGVLGPDGQPLAGATVEAYASIGWAAGWDPSGRPPYLSWQTATDADGRFRLPEVPRDGLRFLLRVRAKDAAPLLLRNLPSQVGRTRELGALRLDSGARLSGMVRGPDGAPVAGAEVVALREARLAGTQAMRTPVAGAATTTGADGRFVLDGLPADTLRLRARAPGLAEGLSEAVPLSPGGTREDVDVLLGATRTLTGVVRDADGEPVGDTALRFLGNSPEPRLRGVLGTASTAADGGFTLTLPSDARRGRLLASAPGTFRADQALDLDAVTTVEVELQPLPRLVGRCTDTSGRPVEGAEVRLVELRSGITEADRLEARATVVTGADGRFELLPDLREAEALRFLVHARGPDGETAESGTFTLLSAQRWRAPELDLRLGDGFRVRGAVVLEDGSPAADARVLLRKLNARRPSRLPGLDESRRVGLVVARTGSDAEGGFGFPAQPVGDYRVEAYLPGVGPGESEEFGLVQGDVRLAVVLPAPAAIVGSVTGPLEQFGPLQVTATQPGRAPLDATVGEDGRFRIDDPWPGRWNLELRERAGALDVSSFVFGGTEALARADAIEVRAGQETAAALRVDVAGLGAVTGRATVDGAPAQGHQVYLLPLSAQVDRDPRIAARSVVRLMKTAPLDAEGRFRVSGIAPDSYWLVLCGPSEWPEGMWEGAWEADSAAPAGLARTRVTVPADGVAEASFSVATGALRIEVTNRDGELLPTAARLVPRTPGVASRGFALGPAGTHVSGLPAGDYTLQLSAGTLRSSVPASVPVGETGAVQVQLAEPHMLQNRQPESLPGLEDGR